MEAIVDKLTEALELLENEADIAAVECEYAAPGDGDPETKSEVLDMAIYRVKQTIKEVASLG